MCEREIQLIAIICLFDFVCGTQNLVSSFDFQEGHLDNPAVCMSVCMRVFSDFARLRTGLKAFPVAAWGILSYAKLRASGRFMELA